MRVVGKENIWEFARKHPNAKSSLLRWVDIVEKSSWRTFVELKRTFASADLVGGQVVFNISGNRARLIARIQFANQAIAVEFVLNHAEYDEGRWKD